MEAQIIINSNEINRYRELKQQGYKTLWVGEGKICLVI
jgi:hypothetical protein